MLESVYQYMDYRAFLRDYVVEQKARRTGFSLATLGRKASGLSKAHLSMILNGKRNLASSRVESLGVALDLSKDRLRYFQNLVRFNQAKSNSERKFFFDQLMESRPKTEARFLEAEQYRILKNWHCLVIRELVALPGFDPSPQKVSERCRGRLSPDEVRTALALLIDTGLVEVSAKGEYSTAESTLQTSDEIRSLVIQDYHRSCLELGKKSLEADEVSEREFASSNIALTAGQFIWLKTKLKELRNEVASLSQKTDESKRVYQLNMQLFLVAE